MARRRKGGALGWLSRPTKRKRGKRAGGMGGFAFKSTGFEKGKRGERGLVGALRLDKKSKRRDDNNMAGKLSRIIADRMTRTERLQVADAVRDARENDEVVSAAERDARRVDPTRQNVIQRLVAAVRNRLSAFRRDD